VRSITELERVQRRITKRIPAVAHMSYCDRLKALGLESLEFRRLRYDLVMMYKIVHNLVDLERDASVVPHVVGAQLYQLSTVDAHINVLKPIHGKII